MSKKAYTIWYRIIQIIVSSLYVALSVIFLLFSFDALTSKALWWIAIVVLWIAFSTLVAKKQKRIEKKETIDNIEEN